MICMYSFRFLFHLLPPLSPSCCQIFRCPFTFSPFCSPSFSSSHHLSPDPTDRPHGLSFRSPHVRDARVTTSFSSAYLRPSPRLSFVLVSASVVVRVLALLCFLVFRRVLVLALCELFLLFRMLAFSFIVTLIISFARMLASAVARVFTVRHMPASVLPTLPRNQSARVSVG